MAKAASAPRGPSKYDQFSPDRSSRTAAEFGPFGVTVCRAHSHVSTSLQGTFAGSRRQRPGTTLQVGLALDSLSWCYLNGWKFEEGLVALHPGRRPCEAQHPQTASRNAEDAHSSRRGRHLEATVFCAGVPRPARSTGKAIGIDSVSECCALGGTLYVNPRHARARCGPRRHNGSGRGTGALAPLPQGKCRGGSLKQKEADRARTPSTADRRWSTTMTSSCTRTSRSPTCPFGQATLESPGQPRAKSG